jgi:hypothetical protein
MMLVPTTHRQCYRRSLDVTRGAVANCGSAALTPTAADVDRAPPLLCRLGLLLVAKDMELTL